MANSSKGLVGCGTMAAVQAGALHMGRERRRNLEAKFSLFKQLIPFTKECLILEDKN